MESALRQKLFRFAELEPEVPPDPLDRGRPCNCNARSSVRESAHLADVPMRVGRGVVHAAERHGTWESCGGWRTWRPALAL